MRAVWGAEHRSRSPGPQGGPSPSAPHPASHCGLCQHSVRMQFPGRDSACDCEGRSLPSWTPARLVRWPERSLPLPAVSSLRGHGAGRAQACGRSSGGRADLPPAPGEPQERVASQRDPSTAPPVAQHPAPQASPSASQKPPQDCCGEQVAMEMVVGGAGEAEDPNVLEPVRWGPPVAPGVLGALTMALLPRRPGAPFLVTVSPPLGEVSECGPHGYVGRGQDGLPRPRCFRPPPRRWLTNTQPPRPASHMSAH